MAILLASGTIIHQCYTVRQLIEQGTMNAVSIVTDQTLFTTVAPQQMFPRPSIIPQQVMALEHAFGHEDRMLHLLRHLVLDTEHKQAFRQHRSDG